MGSGIKKIIDSEVKQYAKRLNIGNEVEKEITESLLYDYLHCKFDFTIKNMEENLVNNKKVYDFNNDILKLKLKITGKYLRKIKKSKQYDRHNQIKRISDKLQSKNYATVYRTDIKKCFYSIPHKKMNEILYRYTMKIEDNQLISNLMNLNREVLGDVGVPPGVSTSNVLVDIFVTDFLNTLSRSSLFLNEKIEMFRFVDDFLFLTKNEISKTKIENCIDEIFEEYGVKRNIQKSQYVFLERNKNVINQFDYLGYKFCFINRDVSLKISEEKVNKYVQTLLWIISSYEKDLINLSLPQKNKELIEKIQCADYKFYERIKYHTSIKVYKSSNGYFHAGFFHNYKYCKTICDEIKERGESKINEKLDEVMSLRYESILINNVYPHFSHHTSNAENNEKEINTIKREKYNQLVGKKLQYENRNSKKQLLKILYEGRRKNNTNNGAIYRKIIFIDNKEYFNYKKIVKVLEKMCIVIEEPLNYYTLLDEYSNIVKK